ncbi:MAG TPA: hypothetical protein PK156_19555 [Polyangium sp.]|nr:hypothetical protein [Polyangium sp.]
MTTLRNSIGLALIMVASILGGVGCVVATNADDSEALDAVDESQDSPEEEESDSGDETETTGTPESELVDGVCAPPCTKI